MVSYIQKLLSRDSVVNDANDSWAERDTKGWTDQKWERKRKEGEESPSSTFRTELT